MKTIPKTLLDLLHADAVSSAFVTLLDFDLGSRGHLRYARYSSDVTYDGDTYSAWPFAGELCTAGKGQKVVTVTLTIEDADQELRPYAIATGWFRACSLRLRIVCVDHLTVDDSWADVTYDIKHAAPQGEAIVLKLGGRNPRKLRFPAERYFCDRCPYAAGFKADPRCGYSGDEDDCDGSLADCIARSNTTHYGGFLGLDPDAAKLMIPAHLR